MVISTMYCLGHSFISLESVQVRGHYIGVTDAGDCKSHLSGGINDNEKFYVIPVQPVSQTSLCNSAVAGFLLFKCPISFCRVAAK